jgi:hypothetical protein
MMFERHSLKNGRVFWNRSERVTKANKSKWEWRIELNKMCQMSSPCTPKPRLHDTLKFCKARVYARHGTLKFWHADPFFGARHSRFLSCKRNIKGPRTQNFMRLKMGPRTENLLPCVLFLTLQEYCVCMYKQNIKGKCGQTKLYKCSDIYMVMHIKKLFNWYSCSTQVKAHSKAKQSEEKRKVTVFKLFKSMHGHICDHGEDYC